MKIRLKVSGGKESDWITKTKKNRIMKKTGMKLMIKKRGMTMVGTAFYIPKGHKLKPLGDDAHFICADQQTMGVADGVGGWSKHGFDSGEFARTLMRATAQSVVDNNNNVDFNPKKILEEAFSKTDDVKGASTACIVTHRDGILRSANVGDSGFMVLRDSKVIYKSQPQHRRFNCPFQLGHFSNSDRPDCAAESQLAVAPGDVVVIGTDGLLDNMFDSDIEAVVKEAMPHEDLACKIAQEAYYKSLDKYFLSPFAVNSFIHGHHHKGGKMDDITVIVAKIVPPHYQFHLRSP